jgi:hypothetical protein
VRRDHNDDSRYGALGALPVVILFWLLVAICLMTVLKMGG